MKVCILGHSASGFLASPHGGSERQTALLARALAARGHAVTFVVTGLTGAEQQVDDVLLRSAWDPDRGVRYLRALTYRYPHLYRLLVDEHADVYYSRGAGYHTPFLARAAHATGARSILGLASDRDLYAASGRVLFGVPDPRVSAVLGPLAHAGFRRWGLRAVDWVAVQNEEQAASCAALGLRHALLPNIVELPAESLPGGAGRDVIWGGNVSEGRRSKGLEELAALAELLPEVSFTVAGTLSAESHEAAIASIRRRPNVELPGQLAFEEMQRALAAHRLVVNTSPSEGFSNVMLEGWASGHPAVTLQVNPSGLLDGDHLGICAGGDLVGMAAAIVALLREPEVRAQMGARARAYVRDTHDAEHVCGVFEALVAGVARGRQTTPTA